ncbi:adenine phosphoribosyltransferase [Arenibacter nanhaiticus]|uniref:Adenine phosphoribosyltransferase n=1 Tax=Arenibacter nanhaiticus TaxID=558155 RepID=A0A1M6BL98_9FLAO|nr:adenine phosphoribosyltransferase [Arenibacter nanhaiticus]SHI49492.1 adenine phosphoribosyltransferase [Arenibacter nanhaiticus]
MNYFDFIREVPDFPRKGISFKDITPLLQNPKALQGAKKALLELLKDKQIDKVVGMESRGFFFGPMLAEQLNAGFVPVRKKGKLPYSTISENYDLEYGQDVLEIHADGIQKGDRVLVHDDVLATGGTASAVCRLIERLGGEVVQCNFLLELQFLSGRDKLIGYEVASLMQY